MQSMYLLIPLSLVLFVVGIWAVYYAIKSRQFDDLDNAAQRIILDDRQHRREQLEGTSNNASAGLTASPLAKNEIKNPIAPTVPPPLQEKNTDS